MQPQASVALLAFGGAVPRYKAKQSDVGQWMAQSFINQPHLSRWLSRVFASAGVETRYSCIDDYLLPIDQARFAPGHPREKAPSTAERMHIYEREAPPLGVAAARQALAELAEATGTTTAHVTASITHLIVVSCTGFFAPGLDIAIARHLNLATTVKRTLIGFMGCAAAFNGLRAASETVLGLPTARVLVVCVELSSLHSQPTTARENLVAASLFADGASACIVGQLQAGRGHAFRVEQFHSELKPETQDQMVWQIGDHGFTLRLAPQIPRHIADIAPHALRCLFGPDTPQFWAIHPGGPAIVERLMTIFNLEPTDVAASRAILRNYGNLSSATIFFVLNELRHTFAAKPQSQAGITGVAMAFGPGLVIELVRLTYLPCPARVCAWPQTEQASPLWEPA